MNAKPPHLPVDCPHSRDGGGGGDDDDGWRNASACEKACAVAILVLLVGAVLTGITFLTIFLDRQFPSKPPVFTVAITGVTGLDQLDPARDVVNPPPSPLADYYNNGYSSSTSPLPQPPPPPAALSPVFNLTFQIDNTRDVYDKACVPGLARADVSYGDAFLAGGSVPPFCAGKKRRSGPSVVRAWGQNVVVPQFLRDQLAAELAAGDASVDVKVTVPTSCIVGSCSDVLSCKAKIGGGGTSSPACRLVVP